MTQSKTLMASRMNRKGSCPVLSGGKSSDNIKGLPIAIGAGWGYQDERQADPGADGAGVISIPEIVGTDGVLAICPGLPDPAGEQLRRRAVLPVQVDEITEFPHSGNHPGQGYQPHQRKQDTVRQLWVSSGPVMEHGEGQHDVQHRDAQPKFERQVK